MASLRLTDRDADNVELDESDKLAFEPVSDNEIAELKGEAPKKRGRPPGSKNKPVDDPESNAKEARLKRDAEKNASVKIRFRTTERLKNGIAGIPLRLFGSVAGLFGSKVKFNPDDVTLCQNAVSDLFDAKKINISPEFGIVISYGWTFVASLGGASISAYLDKLDKADELNKASKPENG